jgi:hypothetical protein
MSGDHACAQHIKPLRLHLYIIKLCGWDYVHNVDHSACTAAAALSSFCWKHMSRPSLVALVDCAVCFYRPHSRALVRLRRVVAGAPYAAKGNAKRGIYTLGKDTAISRNISFGPMCWTQTHILT